MLGALARSAAARRGGVQAVRSFAAAPTSGVEGFTLMNPKNLDDIVKLELLEKEPRENIRRIWETHHDINAGQVGIAMDASVWEAFAANAKQNPMFCLPVPKGGESFVTFLVQMQLPHVFFTLLEEFNRYHVRAQPHMVLTHYTDLAGSKEIVLARGEVNSKVLLPTDKCGAKWLASTTHRFYGDERLARHPRMFNQRPDEFNFKALLQECGIGQGAPGAA